MNDQTYLPIDSLDVGSAEHASPGTLAYIPHGEVRHFLLFGEYEGGKLIMDLGGESPLEVRPMEDGLETAIVVSNWRLEVDPASAVPTFLQERQTGHAVLVNGIAGLVGIGGRIGRKPIAVSVEGQEIKYPGALTHSGSFTRWRIVAGEAERPYVITDSDMCRSIASQAN